MEEGRMMVFDASAYMLFEATGDSEEQDSGAAAAEEEDDARSCSCSSSARLYEAVDGGEDTRSAQFDCFGEEEEDDGEEDGVVDQCRRSEAVEGCEGSMRNEREGDRLFWEACLAS
ncbi:hypothetical protein AAHA92_19738 [Salvia divinorum]|uniref:Uncharacterized protein n=1 Tax=Salvia divinorum TaxID=28513 RepID=A0ABD1GEY5_SALDI